jgi:hypothetical protein
MSEPPQWETLESGALLEEFRVLRAEIQQRVINQLTVAGANLVLVASASQYLVPRFGINIITLAVPILFAAVAWLYFEQDIFIIDAASYIHRALRPAIIARVRDANRSVDRAEQILGWESFRGTILSRRTFGPWFLLFMTFFRAIVTAGPGLAILTGVVIVWLDPHGFPDAVKHYDHAVFADRFFFALDVVLQAVVLYFALHVITLYKTIAATQEPPAAQ